MVEGTHYAEFTLLKAPSAVDAPFDYGPYADPPFIEFGLVGAEFDVADGTTWNSTRSWMLKSYYLYVNHLSGENAWEGIFPCIHVGDRVGLLLDLGRRTLSAYLNGSRRGVIVAPGITQHLASFYGRYGKHDIFPSSPGPRGWDRTQSTTRPNEHNNLRMPPRMDRHELRGPLHWVVDVGGGGSVRIQCKSPPPMPTEAELAAEETAFVTHQVALRMAPQPAPYMG